MSQHFKPEEFMSKDGAISPWPEVVDLGLYFLLEEIRADFGEPIYINSIFAPVPNPHEQKRSRNLLLPYSACSQ